MDPIDLCIPIYLNQQVVFDHLAILEDGFSKLSTIKTTTAATDTTKADVGGSIGVNNVFALLGVTFKGERSHQKEGKDQTEMSLERVHTPTSLFAKLRSMLLKQKLIHQVKNVEDFRLLEDGQFVEFRAVLRKNPLVDMLERFKKVTELAAVLQPESGVHPKGKTSNQGSQPITPAQAFIRQLDGMLSALNQGDSLELLGELLEAPGVTAVLSTKVDYFSDRRASEIIDGKFRVLGKVVRAISEDETDTINLLRKTSLASLNPSVFQQLADSLQSPEAALVTASRPGELVTQIKGPTMQVFPIAIFT